MTTEAASQTQPTDTEQQANPDAARADTPEPEAKPGVKSVEQLRRLLATRKAVRERDAVAAAAERGTRTKAEIDAEKPDPKTGKVRAKSEPADAGKPKSEAKPAAKTEPATERDESGRFVPKDGAKPAPKPAPKPADDDDEVPAAAKSADQPTATEKRIEATAEKLEDAGVKVPEQKADEADKKYEARIARLLLDAREKDAKLREAETKRQAAEERAKKVDEHEALLKRVRGEALDEDALEQLTGKSWVDLIKGVAEGKTKFTPKPRLPPELQRVQTELEQTLAKAREREEAIAQREREAEEAKERDAAAARRKAIAERETKYVQEQLDAEKYPRLAALKHGPSKALERWYDAWADATRGPDGKPTFDHSKQPELSAVFESMENSLADEVSGIFGSERALRIALQDAKTRELALKILAESADSAKPSQPKQSPQREKTGNQTADADGPRTLSNRVTQEAPATGTRGSSVDEKRALQLERLAKWRAGRLTAER